jgi:hypothetical protein
MKKIITFVIIVLFLTTILGTIQVGADVFIKDEVCGDLIEFTVHIFKDKDGDYEWDEWKETADETVGFSVYIKSHWEDLGSKGPKTVDSNGCATFMVPKDSAWVIYGYEKYSFTLVNQWKGCSGWLTNDQIKADGELKHQYLQFVEKKSMNKLPKKDENQLPFSFPVKSILISRLGNPTFKFAPISPGTYENIYGSTINIEGTFFQLKITGEVNKTTYLEFGPIIPWRLLQYKDQSDLGIQIGDKVEITAFLFKTKWGSGRIFNDEYGLNIRGIALGLSVGVIE